MKKGLTVSIVFKAQSVNYGEGTNAERGVVIKRMAKG